MLNYILYLLLFFMIAALSGIVIYLECFFKDANSVGRQSRIAGLLLLVFGFIFIVLGGMNYFGQLLRN